ncbi:hypothetical protein AJ79_03672 [Helicocarpus griseus UAMH5409]|uniref:Aminoglycoside phosphotransferase domain-containing protein n=1 Tax=Helicocarpus griseus UAMH5409 TaxID=1447875 RepID=A0A2B7XX84_9EURO|nr:hypothetical protein AJ79_03672 [Helicocarpus griseus UAMH5409]
MPVERRLLRKVTTCSAVVDSESNYFLKLTYFEERDKFFTLIIKCRSEIEAIVACHLGLKSPKQCHVADIEQWIHGTFNLLPGNADEKVRCEAGACVWLQQECPSIPIPYLHGFGLSNGQHYTLTKKLRWLPWLVQKLRCALLWIRGRQLPSDYVPHYSQKLKNSFGPYLVMEYIERTEGQMLSETWSKHRDDKGRMTNLFQGLSHLMLRLSHIRLPKIGSFIINDAGFLRLDNRPLTSMLQELEIASAPLHIPRDRTYTSVIAYVNDLLTYHDNRLRHDLNATSGIEQYFFVDEDWNITRVIDLEWAASLPVEFIQLPHWIGSDKEVDAVDMARYSSLLDEYISIMEKNGNELYGHEVQKGALAKLPCLIKSGWETGTFWYNLVLRSPPAMHTLFYNMIQPQFAAQHLKDTDFYRVVGFYWCRKSSLFIRGKLDEKEEYDRRLKEEFQVFD